MTIDLRAKKIRHHTCNKMLARNLVGNIARKGFRLLCHSGERCISKRRTHDIRTLRVLHFSFLVKLQSCRKFCSCAVPVCCPKKAIVFYVACGRKNTNKNTHVTTLLVDMLARGSTRQSNLKGFRSLRREHAAFTNGARITYERCVAFHACVFLCS